MEQNNFKIKNRRKKSLNYIFPEWMEGLHTLFIIIKHRKFIISRRIERNRDCYMSSFPTQIRWRKRSSNGICSNRQFAGNPWLSWRGNALFQWWEVWAWRFDGSHGVHNFGALGLVLRWFAFFCLFLSFLSPFVCGLVFKITHISH